MYKRLFRLNYFFIFLIFLSLEVSSFVISAEGQNRWRFHHNLWESSAWIYVTTEETWIIGEKQTIKVEFELEKTEEDFLYLHLYSFDIEIMFKASSHKELDVVLTKKGDKWQATFSFTPTEDMFPLLSEGEATTVLITIEFKGVIHYRRWDGKEDTWDEWTYDSLEVWVLKPIKKSPTPTPTEPSELREKGKGCFIATAVYGTSTSEEIDILRDFRDEVLNHNVFGRIFVEIYYRVSPPLADFIASHDRIRWITRNLAIEPIIKTLQFTKGLWSTQEVTSELTTQYCSHLGYYHLGDD